MRDDARAASIGGALAEALGRPPGAWRTLAHGHTGPVLEVDGLVAKLDERPRGSHEGPSATELEARTLRFLAAHAPVPRVVAVTARALVMERVDGRPGAPVSLAAVLDRLHDVTAARFGFEEDTAIGGLVQRNPWTASWPAFFAEHRLLAFVDALPPPLARRLEALARRIDEVIDAPDRPRLVHGDLWSGNVLCKGGDVVALVDPAPCFCDAELDLSLLDLFGADGAFWPAYFERRPPRPGRDVRARVYRLWPLMVHVRLFGGGYVADVDATLRSLGL